MLSDREGQIAALAAAGLSNRAIAAHLYISVRTVDNHLHHAYEKLGIAGRDELPATLKSRALAGAGPARYSSRSWRAERALGWGEGADRGYGGKRGKPRALGVFPGVRLVRGRCTVVTDTRCPALNRPAA